MLAALLLYQNTQTKTKTKIKIMFINIITFLATAKFHILQNKQKKNLQQSLHEVLELK